MESKRVLVRGSFIFLNRLPFEVAACVPCQRRALAHVRANAAINHHKVPVVGFPPPPPKKKRGWDGWMIIQNPNHLNGKWPDPPSGRWLFYKYKVNFPLQFVIINMCPDFKNPSFHNHGSVESIAHLETSHTSSRTPFSTEPWLWEEE